MSEETSENKYPDPPADMGELLERIEREWYALKEFVTGLPAERLTVPVNGGWSIKDHIVHLSFWEQLMVRSYLGDEPGYAVLGVSEEEFANLNTDDAINDVVYRRNRNRPASEVLTEAWRLHDEVVEAISRVPFERLQQPRRQGDGHPLYAYVEGNTYEHYSEHLGWIKGSQA